MEAGQAGKEMGTGARQAEKSVCEKKIASLIQEENSISMRVKITNTPTHFLIHFSALKKKEKKI